MGYLMPSLLIILTLLISCGKNLPLTMNPPTEPQRKMGFVEGKIALTDGHTVTLTGPSLKPLVLIFSTDTCLVCRGEARALVQRFSMQGMPKKIDLYTVLIGALVEDADEFKKDLSIGWSVGIESGDVLFRNFCPQRKVPCVVVQTPESGVVYRHEGEVTVEELESYTGAW